MNDVLINEKTDGFLMIDNHFLRDWVKVIGIGPAMLYLQLLSYCYGKKDIAFPSLKRLAVTMGVSVKTIVVYRKILVSYGLIKKVIRRKDENGSYQSSMYQLVRFDNNLSREEEIDEDEPVVSEVIDAGEDSYRKSDFTEANDNLSQELKDLGVSAGSSKHLLSSFPESVIRRKLYLLREKRIEDAVHDFWSSIDSQDRCASAWACAPDNDLGNPARDGFVEPYFASLEYFKEICNASKIVDIYAYIRDISFKWDESGNHRAIIDIQVNRTIMNCGVLNNTIARFGTMELIYCDIEPYWEDGWYVENVDIDLWN